MKLCVTTLLLWMLAIIKIKGDPAIDNSGTSNNLFNKNQMEDGFLLKLKQNCKSNDNSSCIMLKLVVYMNNMLKKPLFSINKRLELMQTSLSSTNGSDLFDTAFLGRQIQSDDNILSMLVADKMWQFVKSRAIKWKISDFSDIIISAGDGGKVNLGVSVDAKRALIEGRGKMKNSGPIIAAVVLKGALLGLLAFKALFLLSGKALIVSKLAFLLSSLIGVKKLLSKPKQVTYEVINEHHRHDTAYKPPLAAGQPVQGWQRAFESTLDSFVETLVKKVNDPHSFAYAQQKPGFT